MFTITDICNIAIQIEKNGEGAYRKASDLVGNPEISAVFAKMADDERKHTQWFESIYVAKELTEEQREMEAIGKALLQEMIKDKTFSLEGDSLHEVEDIGEILKKSQGFEKDTILFYEMLSGLIDDTETKAQLQSIIAEEQSHFEELEALARDIATQI